MRLSQILSLPTSVGAAFPTFNTLSPRSSTPDVSDVKIIEVALAGSGCPAGTISSWSQSLMNPETMALPQVTFNAKSGEKALVNESRTNCQMAVKLQYTAGWQFSVYSADYTGHAQLPDGVLGISMTTYYFSGDSHMVSSNTTMLGPVDGSYFRNDRFGLVNTVWSSCHGSESILNINSEVRVGPVKSNQTAVVSIQTRGIVGISWAKCK